MSDRRLKKTILESNQSIFHITTDDYTTQSHLVGVLMEQLSVEPDTDIHILHGTKSKTETNPLKFLYTITKSMFMRAKANYQYMIVVESDNLLKSDDKKQDLMKVLRVLTKDRGRIIFISNRHNKTFDLSLDMFDNVKCINYEHAQLIN